MLLLDKDDIKRKFYLFLKGVNYMVCEETPQVPEEPQAPAEEPQEAPPQEAPAEEPQEPPA